VSNREPPVCRASSIVSSPSVKKVAAEPVREIDFSGAKRGRVTPSQPGKTKISIRLDNAVIDHFRDAVEAAGTTSR